ncbi:MAG: hypothetical protein WA125_06400, partial [Desulfosporosinus sp.]
MKKNLPKYVIVILAVTIVTTFSYTQKDKFNEAFSSNQKDKYIEKAQLPITPLLEPAGISHIEKFELDGIVKDYGQEAKVYKVKKINAKEKALNLAQVFNISVTSERNGDNKITVSGIDGDIVVSENGGGFAYYKKVQPKRQKAPTLEESVT